MKSKKMVFEALTQILKYYDTYRVTLGWSKAKSISKILETYSDFYEWLKENDIKLPEGGEEKQPNGGAKSEQLDRSERSPEKTTPDTLRLSDKQN